MPRVFIPPPLRELTAGQAEVDVDAQNVRQLIDNLEARFPGVAVRLRSGNSLANGIAVVIDGLTAPRSLLTSVASATEVHFLPAISGGCL